MNTDKPCDIVHVLTDFERIIKTQEKNSINCVSKEQEKIYLKLWASYKYAKEIIVNHLINEFSGARNVLQGRITDFENSCYVNLQLEITNLKECLKILNFTSYENRREVLDYGIKILKEAGDITYGPNKQSIDLAIDYLQKFNGLYLK